MCKSSRFYVKMLFIIVIINIILFIIIFTQLFLLFIISVTYIVVERALSN